MTRNMFGLALVLAVFAMSGACSEGAVNSGVLHHRLLRAAGWGFQAGVDVCLQAGADCNNISAGFSALHAAAVSDNVEIIRVLMNAGGCVDVRSMRGVTPLMAAIGTKRFQAVCCLVDVGADLCAFDSQGRTPIMYSVHAIGNGSDESSKKKAREIMAYLLKSVYQQREKLEMYPVDILDKSARSPLQMAVAMADEEAVKMLLEYDACRYMIDGKRNNLLHLAARLSQARIIERIMGTPQGPFASFWVNVCNDAGETPLIIAIRYGTVKAVKLLLRNGANIYIRDERNRGCEGPCSRNTDKASFFGHMECICSVENDRDE